MYHSTGLRVGVLFSVDPTYHSKIYSDFVQSNPAFFESLLYGLFFPESACHSGEIFKFYKSFSLGIVLLDDMTGCYDPFSKGATMSFEQRIFVS